MDSTKPIIISKIVIGIIWLIVALILWFAGLSLFLTETSFSDSYFGRWFLWGFVCAFPLIIDIIIFVFRSAKEGYAAGSKQYYGEVVGNRIYVKHQGVSGFFLSLLFGIFISLLVGPIYLVYKFYLTIRRIIYNFQSLKTV